MSMKRTTIVGAVWLSIAAVPSAVFAQEEAAPPADTQAEETTGEGSETEEPSVEGEEAPAATETSEPSPPGENAAPASDSEETPAAAEPKELPETVEESPTTRAYVDDGMVIDEGASEVAPQEQGAEGWGDLSDAGVTDETPLFQSRLYGFINAYVEKVGKTPARDANGDTIFETNPYEWDVLNFNVMLQGAIAGRYKYFFNLASDGAGSNVDDATVDLRNAWVEVPLIPQYLNIRAGKTYRRFGLYNEILDAVPTFIGIEPPELFDKDHLMLTRTTNFMIHGAWAGELMTLNYSLTTGNDERSSDSLPLGGDVNADFGGWLKIGTSFYFSGPKSVPSRAVGEGSPRGGVLNWMAEDKYNVLGGYIEARLAGLLVQTAFWNGHHDATRDPDQVLLLANGDLNQRQMDRFFVGGDPNAGVNVDAKYDVRTFYTRMGYEFTVGEKSNITPYAQFDYFSNPETIRDKDLGGDNEAGLADNGKFIKYTIGTVIRPIPQVALKLDLSAHQQEYNGETVIYPEGRCSLSYLWEL